VRLKQLLADGRLRPHRPSRREMQERLSVVDRNLRDAKVDGISDDLKHQTAYGAAFVLATMVLSASGHRTVGEGHHWVTFEVLPDLLGETLGVWPSTSIKRGVNGTALNTILSATYPERMPVNF